MGLNPVTRRLHPELARQEAMRIQAILDVMEERSKLRREHEKAHRRMVRELGDDFRLTNLPDPEPCDES